MVSNMVGASINNFDYYDGTNMENIQFYMLPKVLMDNKKFDGISVESKVLYSMMLDRARLSKQNNWLDEMGRIYIYFTVENIQIVLNCSKGKALKMLKELDMENGMGLIERKKGKGMGKADVIYVKCCICEEDIQQTKVINSGCGKDVDKPVDNIVEKVAEPITGTKNEPLVVQNLDQSGTKIEPIVVQNLYPNNTNINM